MNKEMCCVHSKHPQIRNSSGRPSWQRHYNTVSVVQRNELLRLVNVYGSSVKIAAEKLGILYSTAKYIIRNQTKEEFANSFNHIAEKTAKGQAPEIFRVQRNVVRPCVEAREIEYKIFRKKTRKNASESLEDEEKTQCCDHPHMTLFQHLVEYSLNFDEPELDAKPADLLLAANLILEPPCFEACCLPAEKKKCTC